MSKYYHKGNSRLSNNYVYPKKNRPKKYRRSKSRLKRYCRFWFLRLLRLRGKPKVLSRGLAVGVFAGFFPFFGLQTFIGILLATLFRGSKVAAAAGTWISNPLTYLPIYIFNYKVGRLLLGVKSQPVSQLDLQSFAEFKELGFTFAITLIFGCFVVGLTAGIIAYFASLYFLKLRAKS
ncbi:MAG: DUF2062 domain-containing protein [Xenococcaceae cyanobacterium MO_188.B29]|nr:DUF2062 domain-containing protein [Xenococcaceae cyanobacterium MO_188.B29]